MEAKRCIKLLVIFFLAGLAVTSHAADRVRAGQWEGTWVSAGRTRPTSDCITQADADALNGDNKAVLTHLEKVIPPSICTLTDLNVSGERITYTAMCKGRAPNVIVTTYHGDHFSSVDSSGAKSEAKRVGACK